MKIITILALLLCFSSHAQLVFEVNQPAGLSGVFPCMAAKGIDWSSPNLYQNGSWFSDTLLLANDGIAGSSCGTQTLNLAGNLVLFKRTGCNLSEALINAQNAGATGAIVIDSVAGRPLSFSSDPLSNLVTIPFVIISKDKGTQLMNTLVAGDTVIVSFGDKTGVNTTDLGMYKEFALWSKFGVFPVWLFGFPDYHLGTWVYNHGTSAMNNISVERWFSVASASPQETSHVSAPFSLNAGDSVFVPFDWHFDTQSWQQDTLRYGYRLLNVQDDDSLDNEIENYLLVKYDLYSNSYTFSNDFGAVDYMIPIDDSLYTQVDYNWVFRSPFDSLFPDLGCFWGNTVFLGQYTEVMEGFIGYYPQQLTWNLNDTYLPWSESFFFGVTGNLNGSFVQSQDAANWGSTNEFAMIRLNYFSGDQSKTGFTSDMYFDEIYRQSGFPVFFSKRYSSQTAQYELMPIPEIVIPIHYGSLSQFQCGTGLSETTDKNEIKLFPNPSNSSITISSEEELRSIEITDLHGRSVYADQLFNATTKVIHLETLNAGVYLVKCTSLSGNQSIIRFVKQ